MKGVRLVFSSFEVRLMDEQKRKNAEMAPFNPNLAGVARLELTTRGFGDRRSTN